MSQSQSSFRYESPSRGKMDSSSHKKNQSVLPCVLYYITLIIPMVQIFQQIHQQHILLKKTVTTFLNFAIFVDTVRP
jgi:hypothetical protein